MDPTQNLTSPALAQAATLSTKFIEKQQSQQFQLLSVFGDHAHRRTDKKKLENHVASSPEVIKQTVGKLLSTVNWLLLICSVREHKTNCTSEECFCTFQRLFVCLHAF